MTDSPQSWSEMDTPGLLVDRHQLDQNITAFHEGIAANGTPLRAHIKTHKVPEIAQRQLSAGAIGIAAAKVSEAEVFVDAGFDDVVVAYPVAGVAKWRNAAALADRSRLVVHAENHVAIAGLSEAASGADVEIGIRLEVDTGFHRTGTDSQEALAELANHVEKSPGLYLDGITTHRSIFFEGAAGQSRQDLGMEEGRIMVEIAEKLRSMGHDVVNVVGGSTPTAEPLSRVDGITEVCAGTYVFYDVGMADLGVVEWESLALSVSATVVSHPRPGYYTVDAGAKSLSKDRYPGTERALCGVSVTRDDVIVSVTDEHGIVETKTAPPEIGSVVRFYPMHVCPVVNLAEKLVVTADGVVEGTWSVGARGKTR